ncbi:hypothetical protein FA13DRAFT_1287219 [Coprinellus micaceus]|uniref:Uncharacterized protein n=1 Tax=Coprinellus micaceus TaxID=71717 RepID=A0A4Y7ST59_COPMI|nr:hypothetical protein FA13DRAFT_1287219 [Coprinellus micaceus]
MGRTKRSRKAHIPTVEDKPSPPPPNIMRKRSRTDPADEALSEFSDDSRPSRIRKLEPAPFPVSPLSPPLSPSSSKAHFEAMYALQYPRNAEPDLPTVSEVLLDAGLDKIKRNARFREKNPYASNVDGWDSEDELAWLKCRQWEMMEDLGIEPAGQKPSTKRRRPRGKLYTNTLSQPKLLDGNTGGREGPVDGLAKPDVRGKRGPAPFPIDLSQREPTPPPPDPPPLLPDTQIFVNPSAWKPRRLSSVLEDAKVRKQKEGGGDEWTEEDDLLCFRREQWRMMKAMGIETQESEPKGRWRPGMP